MIRTRDEILTDYSKLICEPNKSLNPNQAIANHNQKVNALNLEVLLDIRDLLEDLNAK